MKLVDNDSLKKLNSDVSRSFTNGFKEKPNHYLLSAIMGLPRIETYGKLNGNIKHDVLQSVHIDAKNYVFNQSYR